MNGFRGTVWWTRAPWWGLWCAALAALVLGDTCATGTAPVARQAASGAARPMSTAMVVAAPLPVGVSPPMHSRPAPARPASAAADAAQSAGTAAAGRPADPDALLADALADVAESAHGHFSLAIADTDTGLRAVYAPEEHRFATASIVKADILAALLLRAQREGRSLTQQERYDAGPMIRVSDNASASRLWARIGGGAGLAEANERLGLTATTPGPGGLWGLTRTTAADQLRLLEAITRDDSALSRASRTYLYDLMTHIHAGQDWGVTAAQTPATTTPSGTPTATAATADAPSAAPPAPATATGSPTAEPAAAPSAAVTAPAAALKNGWLPRSATGLWVVNTIGVVEHNGHRLLIAVLSDDQPSMAAGIRLVEAAAAKAAEALTAADTEPPTKP
ncbi:serine hydrolase [Streptomyces himalayensis]|uniref:Serine hydrolase n=1 Tax=Streptomyces himalayensis subsp. himalayensis TaxID=2756131 RepID=A0A7W0DW42_9ACTN|nr:serine hydrolase [Streptomyces himalayensis]MBA2951838.1 serine hydrolase [Streptomyces himalayensis subsp. himalayensis]